MFKSKAFVIAASAILLAVVVTGLILYAAPADDKAAATNTAVAAANIVSRNGACSADLKDGTSVLITGGKGANGAMAGTQIFSAKNGPKDGAQMAFPRANHSCAALPDGRVLVAGGTTLGGGGTNTAEIYDPAADAWSTAGSMSAARSGAAAVKLSSGKILIIGGDSNGNASATLEVFDPATGKFSTVSGQMSSPREQHAAAALPDGTVLIFGGSDGKSALNTIDVYNPATGTVAASGKKMAAARAGLAATTLLNGDIYLSGGTDGKLEMASAEIYQASTGTLKAAAPMLAPRAGHLAIRVPYNNEILIVGGNAAGGAVQAQELYVPWWNSYKSFGAPGNSGKSANAMTAHADSASGTASDASAAAPLATTEGTPVLPTLITDQPDYAPGETAYITGAGWAPNTDVTLLLQRAPQTSADTTWTATTDADGNLSTRYLVIDTDLGVTFTLTASDSAGDTAQMLTFTDNPKVHFVTAPFIANVSTCSPAIVIQTPSDLSEPIALSSSSSTGLFYSDPACTIQISSITTSANKPPRAIFYYRDSTVGSPQITLTDTGTGGEGPGAQTETISNSAIATTVQFSLSPTSAIFNAHTQVTLTATLTRSDTNGVLSGGVIDFIMNGTDLGTANTNASGVATLTFYSDQFPQGTTPETYAPLPQGSYSAIAEFSGAKIGSNTYAGANSAFQTFTVTGTAPAITSGNATTFTYGSAGTFAVTATGTPTPTLSESGALPGGVTFTDNGNGTATMAGTPTAVGAFPFTITAANGVTPNATQSFTLTVQKANQAALAVTGPSSVTYGTTGTATASGGTGTGAVSFDAGASTGCKVTGTTVSVTDATGSCVLTATQAADTNYNAVTSAPFTVTLNKATQATLTVTGPASITYGTTGVATTSGGSGSGAVSFSAGSSTGCAVTGTTVSVSNTGGSCTLTATQAGDNNYNSTTSAPFTVTLNKANQATLTVTGPGTVTYGATGTATSSGGSGSGAVSFSAGSSTGCAVVATTVSVNNASGSCILTATQAGDNNYNSTTSAPFTVTLNKANQAIVVNTPNPYPSSLMFGTPFTTTATGGASGNVVTIAGTGACSGSGNDSASIQMTAGAGICTVSYNQAGNSNYNAAAQVTDNVTAMPAPQSISFTDPTSAPKLGDAPFTEGVSATSGDAVTVTSTTPSVCEVNGISNTGSSATGVAVTILSAGTCNLSASAPADGNYSAAANTHSLSIGKYAITGCPSSGCFDSSNNPIPGAFVTISSTVAYLGQATATVTMRPSAVANLPLLNAVTNDATTPKFTVYLIQVDNQGNPTGTPILFGSGQATLTTNPAGYQATIQGTLIKDFNPNTYRAYVYGDDGSTLTKGIVVADAGYTAPDTTDFTYPTLVSNTLTVTQAAQTITFDTPAPTNATYNSTFPVAAHSDSGLTVSLTVDAASSSVCSLGTSTVTDGVTSTTATMLSGTGTCTIDANQAGNVDYTAATLKQTSATAQKANASIVVTPYNVKYDGNAHTATGTATGAKGESLTGLDLTNTTHTNAGTYSTDYWTFTDSTGNYNNVAKTTITDTISKADAVVSVTGYSVTYDGSPHTATGSATGVKGDSLTGLDLSATVHTNAGDFASDPWTFTDSTGNYNNTTGSVHDSISKASSVTTVTGGSFTYDGTAHAATVTVTGAGGLSLTPSPTYTGSCTSAPVTVAQGTSCTATYNFGGDTNHTASSGSATVTITKAPVKVIVGSANPTYDGTPKTVGMTVAPTSAASLVVLTYTSSSPTYNSTSGPTGAGTYTATASLTDSGNYGFSGDSVISGTLTIAQASSTTKVTGGSYVYDGMPHAATVTVTGAGGLSLTPTLIYSGTCTAAPATVAQGTSCTASYTFSGDANHTGSNGSATVTITARTASVTPSNSMKYYGQLDPTPLTTATLNNFVLADGITASFTRTAGEAVGSYAITATLSPSGALANYNITYNTATFTINKRLTSITVDQTGYSFIVYDCSKDVLKATLIDNLGSPVPGATVTFLLTSTTAGVPSQTLIGTTDINGVAQVAMPLTLPVGSATLTVTYTGDATHVGSGFGPQSETILVNPNVAPGVNASTLYTGSRFFWTTSSTSSTATLTLTATIRDSTECANIGNITKATVSFLISTDGNTFTPVSSAQNLPVGLVNPTDNSTGTASVVSQYNLGKSQSAQLWVRVVVGGQYAYSSDTFDVPITVAIPGQANTLLAGGALNNDGSSVAGPTGYLATGYFGSGNGATSGGVAAGDVDFAGTVTYTSKGTNPQGQLTATIRSYNKADGTPDCKGAICSEHAYFVKSNSISGMTETLDSNAHKTVSFTAKQNVYELVSGGNNGLDGGGVMQFNVTEAGGTYQVSSTSSGKAVTLTCPVSAGPSGCMSLVVYKSTGGVWFSSAWGPATTSSGEQPQTIEKVATGVTSIQ